MAALKGDLQHGLVGHVDGADADPHIDVGEAHLGLSNRVCRLDDQSFRRSASETSCPIDFRVVLGSPPLRCLTASVVFSRPLTLLTPATYSPSHFTLNLKFL